MSTAVGGALNSDLIQQRSDGTFMIPQAPFPVIVCWAMATRWQFSQALAGMIAASGVDYAQTAVDPWAGASIVDCHHHLRPTPEANIAHLDGSGISNGMALAHANSAEQMQALREKYPGRFLGGLASADITKPEAADLRTKAARSGAGGLGEIKCNVEAG